VTVFFGGHEAPQVQCWSASTLICILPPAVAPGPVVVTVQPLYDAPAAAVNVAELWPQQVPHPARHEASAPLPAASAPPPPPPVITAPHVFFVYKDGTAVAAEGLEHRMLSA
jgi:hypothetical protein